MSKMLTPMELYHAARETCLRLYVANGGGAHDRWIIRPYPGTAAIAQQSVLDRIHGPVIEWTLCMPALPLDVRVPKWHADLIGAYTVHELCHALWTDWNAVAQARREGLHGLTNALEDCRIEGRASRGDMLYVTEARRLLEMLNAHIAGRALASPDFALDDAPQFSFVLGLVIFAEKLGYVSQLPGDWKAHVRPQWLPLFDLALSRFDALTSTSDVLQLARDLKALAASLPKTQRPPRPTGPQPQPRPEPGEGEPGEGEGASMPREAEIVEEEPEPAAEEGANGKGAGEAEEGLPEPEEAPRPPRPQPGFDKPSEAKPEASGGQDDVDVDEAPQMAGDQGSYGGARSEPEPEPAEDLSDGTQVYEEAHLNDLAAQAAKDAGKRPNEVNAEALHAATVINVALPRTIEPQGNGDPKRAGAAISSPAKLRRHLTLAVKSPERIGVERGHVSGRLDMRALVGISIGAPNVFKRRVEDEGREAAVGLLLDISGSMKGQRMAAAKALAIHMGDALRAAGIRFEVAAFDDAHQIIPKPYGAQWNVDTQRAVAGLRVMGGTAMLPATKAAAERLLRVANVTRRILLVLTDGADSFHPDANCALARFYAGRGVEVIGIGLHTGGIQNSFAGRGVTVWDTSSLSEKGLGELVKALA